MFLRNGMIHATNPTFDQRPETLDSIGVDIPTHIDFLRSDVVVELPSLAGYDELIEVAL